MKSTCGACRNVFASLGAFDMHRVGSYGEPVYNSYGKVVGYTPCARRCLTEQEMLQRGMIKSERGHWTTGVIVDFGHKAG